MPYIRTLKTINDTVNPAALFPEDHEKAEKMILNYNRGFLILSETMEQIIKLSLARKETM